MIERGNLLFAVTQVTRKASNLEECSMFGIIVDRVLSNVQFLNQEALLYVFEDSEAVIKMIMKGRSPSMRHVSRTHRVCFWLVIRSNQLDPKNPNQVHRPREISHVTNGIIFCDCSPLAISILQFGMKWCQRKRKKNQVKKESQQSQDQRWVWLQGLLELCHLRHQKARRREVMKVRFPGVRKLKNMIERWNPLSAVTQVRRQGTTTNDLLEARTQHAHQDRMMTKLGLLKSGKPMNWWMIERGLPFFAFNKDLGHSNSS